MASSKSIWFHLGHAYERARLTQSESGGEVTPLRKRRAVTEPDGDGFPAWPSADDLFSAAAWLVLDGVVGRRGRSRPGIGRLVKAGVAGGAAALVLDLLRPLLTGDGRVPLLDAGTIDRVLAGVGQGLVYGALVEPTVPGPALLKGVLYGSVEYATDPMGGLSRILSKHTPQGKLPVIGGVLDGMEAHERAYFEHLVFGIALALLYEPGPASNGTAELDDDL